MNSPKPEFVYCGRLQTNNSGSLKSIRLGVKDLFHIAGIPTSAGNPDWLDSHAIPTITAPSVKALLTEGATLIGKTLTDELAYSLEGINQHYGTPINPQAPQRIPGGSSSGSAVAVANGSIDLGLGTDTGGSIRVPASYNGIYGFRPSHDLVSCEQLIPLSPRFDTVGWMTRDIASLKRAAEVLLPSQNVSKLPHLVVANIEGIDNWQTAREPLLDVCSEQFESVRYVELTKKNLSDASQAFRVLQGREIWRIHGRWIEQHQPNFASEIGDRFKWCSTLTLEDEQQAEKAAQAFISFWKNILPDPDCVLLLPTTPGAAPLLNTSTAELRAYRTTLMGLTAPAGLTRAPQITLPYLSEQQAPWGISLLGSYNGDRSLLNCAANLDTIWRNCKKTQQ